jgi:hypothetical protein
MDEEVIQSMADRLMDFIKLIAAIAGAIASGVTAIRYASRLGLI